MCARVTFFFVLLIALMLPASADFRRIEIINDLTFELAIFQSMCPGGNRTDIVHAKSSATIDFCEVELYLLDSDDIQDSLAEGEILPPQVIETAENVQMYYDSGYDIETESDKVGSEATRVRFFLKANPGSLTERQKEKSQRDAAKSVVDATASLPQRATTRVPVDSIPGFGDRPAVRTTQRPTPQVQQPVVQPVTSPPAPPANPKCSGDGCPYIQTQMSGGCIVLVNTFNRPIYVQPRVNLVTFGVIYANSDFVPKYGLDANGPCLRTYGYNYTATIQ